MDSLKKIIGWLDNVADGNDMSIRQKITITLWGMSIVLLPFCHFPYGPFERLALYPLIIIAFLNIDKWWNLCWHNKYLRWIGLALWGYVLWQIVTLPFTMNISEISFSCNIFSIIRYAMSYGAFYVFLASFFLFPRKIADKIFFWCLTCVLLYCSAYSGIELLHFSGVQWATDFLAKSIHYIMEVQKTGWYPPLFWNSERVRSVFAEPSHYAMLLVFCIIYYASQIWLKKKCKIVVVSIAMTLLGIGQLCLTKGMGGAFNITIATVFFGILFSIFFRKFTREQKIKGVILILSFMICSFFTIKYQRGGVVEYRKIAGISKNNIQKPENSNQKTVLSGSTNTRTLCLKMDIETILSKPLFGIGAGNYPKYMSEAHSKQKFVTHELLWWISLEKIPKLIPIAAIAVESGILGALLFLMFLSGGLFISSAEVFVQKDMQRIPSLVCAFILLFSQLIFLHIPFLNLIACSVFMAYANDEEHIQNDEQ